MTKKIEKLTKNRQKNSVKSVSQDDPPYVESNVPVVVKKKRPLQKMFMQMILGFGLYLLMMLLAALLQATGVENSWIALLFSMLFNVIVWMILGEFINKKHPNFPTFLLALPAFLMAIPIIYMLP